MPTLAPKRRQLEARWPSPTTDEEAQYTSGYYRHRVDTLIIEFLIYRLEMSRAAWVISHLVPRYAVSFSRPRSRRATAPPYTLSPCMPLALAN